VNQLVSYTNLDWFGDTYDMNLTSDYVFHLGSRPIVWSCKKQKIVSLLTIKAKYIGVVSAGIETMWIHNLMGELEFSFEESIVKYCDNQSAIQVVEILIVYSRMKHIELHAYFLR
jgi:hypothetical protein